jgi:hypothetical protein
MTLPLPNFGHRNAVIRRVIPVAVLCAAAAVAAMVVLDMRERAAVVADASDEAQVSRIVGPPCPTLTAQAFTARGLEAGKTFDFGGLTFSRRFGHAQCNEAASGGLLGAGSFPVCQFTSPDVLAVKAGKALYLFEPGLGRKATILARDGKVSCVMAAPYWAA